MNPTLMNKLPLVLLLGAGFVTPALAQDIVPFQNGQVADATAVNSNFNALKTSAAAAQATAGTAQATADTAQATATAAQTAVANLTGAITIASGNVGIGTTPAGARLQVAGSLHVDGTRVRVTDANTPNFALRNPNSGKTWELLSYVGNGMNFGDLVIQRAGTRVDVIVHDGNAAGRSPGDFEILGAAFKPGGGSWSSASDLRLKKNVAPIDGALDTLLALRGVHFEYKDPAAIHELPGQRTGFIAQEVEQVMPDWVSEDERGLKRVTVRGFEALAVESLRELKQGNDRLVAANAALRADNEALHARLEALEAAVENLQPLASRGRVGR
ncbi:MAG TPA: tail fiber domain-containing protein [Planctomycetota bacterium]|nr:tail fiber domain-containing protein [Planctomycetota bacterium]